MKTVWMAITLLLIVLAGAFSLFFYTTSLYSQLQDSLHRIHHAAEKGDWTAAQRESEQLKEIWTRTDASWTPIMDHRQVDHLDESLARVLKLAELQNREELLVELVVAMRQAKRIIDTEVPSLRNIF